MNNIHSDSADVQKHRFFYHWHIVTIGLVVYDFLVTIFSFGLALWLRFDCVFSSIPSKYLDCYVSTIVIYAAILILLLFGFKRYRSIWRFASYSEIVRMGFATFIAFIIYTAGTVLFIERMPISYYVVGTALQFIFTLGIRFSYRFVLLLRGRNAKTKIPPKNVMIIGAGNAGQFIHRDIKASVELNEKVVCYIDDNPNKVGRYIDNVLVVGDRNSILKAVEDYKVEKIYLAIPSASAADKRDLLSICNETDCKLMNLPGIYQLATGEVKVAQMKEVSVEDLLGRDPIKTDMTEVLRSLTGKVVMVTGGGGSIGSELCRQIAAQAPKTLIIFDIYENNAYDIQLELKEKYPNLHLETLIGSVRDSRRIFQVFEDFKPDIVYHAAAHKHVPLMEDSPCEAIKNNAIGTYKTAFAAMAHHCDKFVLISTDKAVNPANVMGATKRLCEMIVQAFDRKIRAGEANQIPQLFTHWMQEIYKSEELTEALSTTKTEFVAVRFGNVLGSNGSVIPLFKRQIAKGGPVTVTHPDIIRYFMTIPEAVSLVLQAGTQAHGGEIFVLDMGEPVKIDTLARNLIRLSGLKPDVDIKIQYSGLRPGEKLFEEKLMAEEGLRKTDNDNIHIGCPIPFDIEEFLSQLDTLMEAAYKNKDDIRTLIGGVVNTYHPESN
ncbi:MAG: polysaccharide biosynthesis protein [Saccharofermentans sp.]|nr:polysaccharide biosynthesis protein [Saccharofermentans sp.]